MIDPLKYYPISDVLQMAKEGYFPVKSRMTLLRLIRSGKIRVLNTGTEDKPVYHFKGETLLQFLDDKGKLQISRNKKQ